MIINNNKTAAPPNGQKLTMTNRIAPTLVHLLLLITTFSLHGVSAADYLLIGVSGGLQEGFPANSKLHYHNKDGSGEVVKAIFLGRGLVRGYKAFLDVMEPGWREFDSQYPVINSNVFASGCYEHANEYWLYLVDVRQVLSVLNNEPRFLSMTPDTGMIELNANETHPLARDFLQTHLQQRTLQQDDSSTKIDKVAIPLVTCVHFQETSHVPSPIMYTHEDGTQVTNFPDSLALWAKVEDGDRTALLELHQRCDSIQNQSASCQATQWKQAKDALERYWKGIRAAIWKAEENRPTREEIESYAPPFKCQQTVRFGVGSPETTRVNYPFSAKELKTIFHQMKNVELDLDAGVVSQRSPSSQERNVDTPEL